MLGMLLLGGCIHLEQSVRINRDGSAVVSYHYSLAEEDLATLAAIRKMVDKWQRGEGETVEEGLNWFVNREAVEKHFAANGAEVQVYRQYRQGGRKHVEVTVFMEDAEAGLNSGVFGPFELLATPDGNLLLRVATATLTPDAAPSASRIEHLKALVGDLRIRFEVEVPTAIVSATTTEKRGHKAVWIFEAKKDDAFLRKLPDIHLIYAGP